MINEKWYVNYRWNRGDDRRRGGSNEQTANVFTLSFWPLTSVRFKMEYALHDFVDLETEDYRELQFFIGYIF